MDSTFLVIWRVWLTFLCLASCYFYAYFAAFGIPEADSTAAVYDWLFQSNFMVAMLIEFVTTYRINPGEPEVRDITEIVPRYLQGNFLFELLPLLPFQWMFAFDNGQEKLFLLVKLIRLVRGLSIFQPKYIKHHVSSYFKWRTRLVLKEPEKANSKLVD